MRRRILYSILAYSCVKAEDAFSHVDDGKRAAMFLEIRTQLGPVITQEFKKLQMEMMRNIKTTFSSELKKLREEFDVKQEIQTSSVSNILIKQENIVQQITDLSITFENLQKQSNNNLQATTESLTSGFFETKTEVGQQMALFKSELQQSRTHMDNYESKLLAAQGQALAEHTNKMFDQSDRSRKDTITSINNMHQTLTQRISQISSRSVNEFKNREVILKRAIQEEFGTLTTKLDGTLGAHKRELDKKFQEKVDENRQIANEDNTVIMQTINGTLHGNLNDMQRMMDEREIGLKKQLRIVGLAINDTLADQADKNKVYIEHTIGSFRDDINSIMTEMQNTFDDSMTTSVSNSRRRSTNSHVNANVMRKLDDSMRSLKATAEETKVEASRASKEITKTLEIMMNGHKIIQNRLDIGVSKLNRSMTDRAWAERRELIDQIRKSQEIVTHGMNNNHDSTKVMFETTVTKTLKDSSKTHTQNFDDIMRKLTDMEDAKADSIPQLTDAMQNIVRNYIDDVKAELSINKASFSGKLATIEASTAACVRNVNKKKDGSSMLSPKKLSERFDHLRRKNYS